MMDTTGNPKRFVFDSLAIEDRVYHEVVLHRKTGTDAEQPGLEELYYNKTHGVLQMKKDGKAVFTLQEYIPAR